MLSLRVACCLRRSRSPIPRGTSSSAKVRLGGRLVQDPQHIVVLNSSPGDFSLMRSATDSPREEQMMLVKVAHRRTGGSCVLEAEKDLPDGSLYLQIGIKHNCVSFGVTQPDG